MIGNPFTDVPELCSQVLVMTDGDAAAAEREATRLAEEFWPLRFRMQGKLIALDRAIAQASIDRRPGHLHRCGRRHVVRRDRATAMSIIKALRDAGYQKRVLAPIVDAQAAAAAHEAGVGADDRGRARRHRSIRQRFPPMQVKARGEAAVGRRARGSRP